MSALRAAFADFKLVRTRGVAQLVMEVPIEEADAALALLGGVPKAAAEKWVGIAPLLASDGDRETSPEKPEPPARPGGRPAPSDEPCPKCGGGEMHEEDCPLLAEPRRKAGAQLAGERIRTRAVMLCKDEGFQKWATGELSGDHWDESLARNAILLWCGIGSRAELATNPEAQKKFLDLEARYRAETGRMAEKRGA
jgi:hypothetical protein